MTETEIKAQMARVEKERIRLGTFWHFYRVILSSLPDDYSPVAGVNTAATDGRRIYWNLNYISKLDTEELQFVLAHESLHCVLLHHLRGRGLDQRLLNIAGDYVINLMLTDEGVGRMPEGCLLDAKYRGWSTEEVYESLLQELADQPKPQPQKAPEQGEQGDDQQSGDGEADTDSEAGEGSDDAEGDGEAEGAEGDGEGKGGAGESEGDDTGEGASGAGNPGKGSKGQGKGNEGPQGPAGDEAANGGDEAASGAGNPEDVDPGHCGGVIQGAETPTEEAEKTADWQRIARSAVSAAAKQAGGKVDSVGKMVLGNLDAAQVRWEDELAEFISVSISKDYSWARPDNRFHGCEFSMPGLVSDAASWGVLLVDTSGSMSDDQIQRCIEEIQGIADSGMVDRISVVCIDTDVHNVEHFERGDRITMDAEGRGGTKYQPAWQWLSEQDETPDFVVYLTDLEPWAGFGDEPNVPLLWAASTYAVSARPALRERMAAVPFGRCIEVV
jgi:predicted metal-dependent peptidase